MLTVPQDYHTYSAAQERRTDLVARLEPYNWPTDIDDHGTAHSICMPIQWDKSPPHSLYATGEYNRTPLDGRALVNGWDGQVYGYLSNALSDKDGLFSADAVKISCTRNASTAHVMTICFDPAAGEYAVDFDVVIDGASASEAYHQEWHIRDNDQPITYITGIHAAYDTVTITVSRWSHPFHRARIRELANGVLLEVTGDTLYSCSLVSEADPTNQSIPTGECTLTYPDPQGLFDPANPNGVSGDIKGSQMLAVWIGVSDGQHKPVYAKVGTYYNPKASSKGGTGTLEAVDILGKVAALGKVSDTALEYLNSVSLRGFVSGLGASPATGNFDGEAPTAFAEGTSRLECLRYVAQYLQGTLYADADGHTCLQGISRTPSLTIPLDQSYDYPAVETREELGGIDYTWHRYDGEGEEILVSEEQVISIKDFTVPYTVTLTEPAVYTRYEVVHEYAGDFEVTITATGSRKVTYTVYTDANFTEPEEYYVTIRLYGKKIEEHTSTGKSDTNDTANKDQNRMSIDNPIPHSGIFDQLLWDIYLRRAYGKMDVACTWRGDASLQVGDAVTVEGRYGPLDGVVIKQEIDYDGALQMHTTVRQPDWLIDLEEAT